MNSEEDLLTDFSEDKKLSLRNSSVAALKVMFSLEVALTSIGFIMTFTFGHVLFSNMLRSKLSYP